MNEPIVSGMTLDEFEAKYGASTQCMLGDRVAAPSFSTDADADHWLAQTVGREGRVRVGRLSPSELLAALDAACALGL